MCITLAISTCMTLISTSYPVKHPTSAAEILRLTARPAYRRPDTIMSTESTDSSIGRRRRRPARHQRDPAFQRLAPRRLNLKTTGIHPVVCITRAYRISTCRTLISTSLHLISTSYRLNHPKSAAKLLNCCSPMLRLTVRRHTAVQTLSCPPT